MKRMRGSGYFISFFFLLTLSRVGYAFAQETNPPPLLRFHSVAQENGLTMHMVVRMFRDSKGFMWLFNEEDISRFDGRNVKSYYPQYPSDVNFPSTGMTYHGSTIIEDSHANIWFNTSRTLICYERKTDSFLFYPLKDNKGNYVSDFYGAFVLENNLIYLFSDKIKLKFDVRERKYYADDKGFFRIPVWDSGDSIFINNVNGKVDTVFTPGQIPGIKLSIVFPIIKVNDTALYAATNKGLLFINPATKRFEILKNKNPGLAFEANDVAVSRIIYHNAFIWAATPLHGLLLFDTRKKEYVAQYLDGKTDKVNSKINDIIGLYMDYENNIWVSSFNQNLAYANLNSQKFISLLSKKECEEKGLDNFIRCITVNKDGNIWCGTAYGGAIVFDKSKNIIAQYPFPGKPYKVSHHMEYMMTDSKGRIWVASWDGFYIFDETIYEFRKINVSAGSTPAEKFNYVIELHDGTLLISSNNEGYFTLDEKSLCLKTLDGFNLDPSGTFLFQDKKGRIYFLDHLFDIRIYPSLSNLNSPVKIIPVMHRVKAFYETDSVLWISTISGLMKLDLQTFIWNLVTDRDGLPDEYLYAALPDTKGNLWLSSNHGIIKYNPVLNTFKNYTVEDGLQSNEFDSHAFLLRKDGEMWFGGVNGINAFYPDSLSENIYPAKPTLVSIKVNDEEFSPHKLNIGEETSFTFPYSQRTLSFEFASPEFTDASRNQFMYKMDAYDKEWVQSGTRNFARYANLPAGDYTFQVKAANSDGVWDPNTKQLGITILAPWWQAWWFRILVISITIIIVLVSFRTYTQKKLLHLRHEFEKRHVVELERKRISSEMHDDLGSGLSKIALLSEVLRQGDVGVQSGIQLEKISASAKQALETMSEIVWSLNPKNDSLQNLTYYIRKYAMEYLETSEVHCKINMETPIPLILIGGEQRRNIFLCVKESLHNVVKHSGAKKVELSFLKSDGMFEIIIHDDGIGIVVDRANKWGNGLNNMKNRMTASGGTFSIENRIGTTVKLSIPIR